MLARMILLTLIAATGWGTARAGVIVSSRCVPAIVASEAPADETPVPQQRPIVHAGDEALAVDSSSMSTTMMRADLPRDGWTIDRDLLGRLFLELHPATAPGTGIRLLRPA